MKPAARIFWQRHGLTALLGLAAFGCLAALGVETQWGRALRPALPVANAGVRGGDMVATLPAFNLPSLDSAFRESGERPLFTPTRRPSAVNLASAPVMKKGQFKLSGTSVNNDLTVAFLLETATGKTVRVTKGKEVNGMTLDAVEPDRVVLKQGDETEELVLRTAASPPAPKVVVPPPGTAPAGPGVAPPMAQPQPTPRPALPQAGVAPNMLSPPPGSSQLPGFVMPPSPAPAAAQTQAAPADAGNPAQRRRRNPAQQQQ